jgi:hypothetical protein
MKCACRKLHILIPSFPIYKGIYLCPARQGHNTEEINDGPTRGHHSGPPPTPRISHFWRLVRDCAAAVRVNRFRVSFFPPPVCFFHGEKIKKKVSNHFPFSLFLLAPADDVVVVGKVKIENRKLAARLLL